MRAQRMTDRIAYHGEGPVWWVRTGHLRIVDMLAGAVVTISRDGGIARADVGSSVAAMVRPRAGGGAIVARERDVAVADDDLTAFHPITPTFVPDGQRLNEGGCDPAGRLFIGGMAYDRTPQASALWLVDGSGGEPPVAVGGATISNGIEFSPDGALAYYADTPTHTLAVFDYSEADGLTNRRTFVDVTEEGLHPDGLTVDADGGVWVAMNGASRVHRYAPDGSLSAVVELPVEKITACTFGGDGLTTLFITTSREDLPDDVQPAAGSVFAVEPGVAGRPVREFCG